MPYNTRRKSLSLPSLGIHVPVTHAARAAAAAARSSSTPDTPSPAEHPQKRQKRSHEPENEPAAAPKARPATRIKYEHTPPPSPESSPESSPTPDTPGDSTRAALKKGAEANDTIVEAVIAQLRATGNRPHLVKELAAVLAQRLAIVQHSANPCAIISSRLASFLKRTCWAESAPCPLAKELEAVHPRRTYYFLTTSPRQPFPAQPLFFTLPKPVMTTPSITSDEELSFEEEAIEEASESDMSLDAELEAELSARRRALSPSPEIDLSSPEFDDADDDLDSPPSLLPSRASLLLDREGRARGTSPPLERDEREFTQTANGLQKRKIGPETAEPVEPAALDEGSRFDSLFYDYRGGLGVAMVVSPLMKASPYVGGLRKEGDESWVKFGRLLDWDSTPETMELEELDCLLDAF